MMQRPDGQIELARAAMLVAAESEPELDVEIEMATVELWAHTLQSRIDPEWNSLQRLARLRTYLYDELGFRGDARDYYSPQNSLLHSVIARRMGIPLTLAILFMELGWRIGIPFEGVSFPGHFLVRLSGEPGDLLLDAFDHGTTVSEEDCRRMLHTSSGGTAAFAPGMLQSVGRRDMIARLLYNLKVACLRAGDQEQALSAIDRLLVLHPDAPTELRDRGMLLYQLDRYRLALDALQDYLRVRPGATDRDVVEKHLAALRMMLATG